MYQESSGIENDGEFFFILFCDLGNKFFFSGNGCIGSGEQGQIHEVKQGRTHGNLVTDGCVRVVVQKPLASLRI